MKIRTAFLASILISVLVSFHTSAQRGKDGDYTVVSTGEVLNTYTYLTANASAGATSITVFNNSMSGGVFSGNLAAGDLILIIQMQGANIDINTTPTTSWGGAYTVPQDYFNGNWEVNPHFWGQLTGYNNAGKFEQVEVSGISGSSTILLNCALQNNYTSAGHVQVVRIPRFNNLTVPNTTSIVATDWDGQIGGVVALEVDLTLDVNAGGEISASAQGFRGGELDPDSYGGTNDCCAVRYLGSYSNLEGSEKGESIFGWHTELDAKFSRYGIGAPANGGGGGGYQNCGGGGGSNIGGNTYLGRGTPPGYSSIWDLEAAGFGGSTEDGGGRGGYSWADTDANETVIGPGQSNWGGDWRKKNGGFGGHPLTYDPTRIFLGGGGGAGDQDAPDGMLHGGAGGRGGGLVYITNYGDIIGDGVISADGEAGQKTNPNNAPLPNPFSGRTGIDGAGGGGAGGWIRIENINALAATINLTTIGGDGGDQDIVLGSFAPNEASGPGGSGSGGAIAYTSGTPTQDVSPGVGGVTNSTFMTNFPPNGATEGASGTPDLATSLFDLVINDTAICAGQTVDLTVTVLGSLGGASVEWYTQQFGGVSFNSGLTYTTPVLGGTTTYYIGTCPGTFRIPVTITILPAISITVVGTDPLTCGGTDGYITISGLTPSSTFDLTYDDDGLTQGPLTVSSDASGEYVITGLDAGTYENFLADFGGCTGTDPGPINLLNAGSPSAGTDVQAACVSYTWIDGITYSASTNLPTYTYVGGAANGCDSIVTLNLTINNLATGTDVQTACVSYTWIDGITYNASTNAPTYTYVGGAANGCDSTVTLDLTINNPTVGTDVQTACVSYTWIDGVTYNASTNAPTYTYVGGAVNGCDSTVTLDLTINNPTTGTDVQTACVSYTWIDGVTYNASTNTPTYTYVGGAANGCDSTVTLDLTINNPTTGTDVQVACVSYTWIDGVTYNASTNSPTYTYVGGAVNGCDSTVTLNLTINTPAAGTDIQTACDSYTWIDGVTYNASTNSPTYTYVGGAANGCDSTVTLNLTINNATTGTDIQTACVSYTWIDGVTYNASTNTPTYTYVGGAANGCDSTVTLNLTINAPATGTDVQAACVSYTWIDGVTYNASTNTPTYTYVAGAANGCDSTVTLDLTINNPTAGTDVQTACISYTWIDGVTYNASTNTPTYTYVGGAANGCDSTVTLDLTINTFVTGTDVQTACVSYTWIDGVTYNASTNTPTYTYVGGSSNGCDSVVTLNLTINSPTVGTDVQTACVSYTWIDGVTYNASTNTPTYTYVGGAVNGCDSTVTLDLTINNPTSGTDSQVACVSYTWIDGVTYNASTNSPTYTYVGGAVNGCDSTVTLNLTINTPAAGTDIQTACDSYTWIDGVTYNASTNTPTYTFVGGAANGCDSTVTLNLTINNATTGTDIQTACVSYTWIDGVTYNASTNTPTYTYVGGAANGCDSTVTLNLTINAPATGTDVQTACVSYTWIDGVTYNASTNTPTYTYVAGAANGCDSTVTLDLTINNPTTGTDVQTACISYTWIDGVTYNASTNTPTYTYVGGGVNGCDSTVTLDLTVNNPTTGTDVQIACVSYTWIDGVTYNASTNTPTYTYVGGAANGCDSTVTLDLTITSYAAGTDVQTACVSFTWIDGVTYNASTNTPTYTYVGGSVNGCDSIVTLNLTINNPTSGTDVQTACDSYTWIDGVTYNVSTNTPTYTYVGGATNGCDSTVTLDLTINNPTTGTDVQTACVSYTWIDGVTYNASTNSPTYTFAGGAANGCDSTVTLDLTINNPTTGTDVQSACDSYTWIDGVTYNMSTNTPTYTYAGGAANGCDSTVTLNLTVNNTATSIDVQTACDSYTWIDGVTYSASTNTPTYTFVGGAINGCDSIVTLDLTINTFQTGIDVQTACNSYTWIDGVTYNASTNTPTYTYVGGAANGCDSIVTLDLTISPFVTGTDIQSACDTYTWIDGVTYNASTNTPTYTYVGGSANGCDSVVTLDLTINTATSGVDVQVACDSYTWIDGNIYNASNNTAQWVLTNVNGCDSTVTLNLTITNSTTGTDSIVTCDSYTWIDGVTYNSDNNSATWILINNAGCDSTVTLNLTIDDCGIVVPTAITPDGDMVNEVWDIVGLDNQYPKNYIRVYNRWGALIFEHDSQIEGPYSSKMWDGTHEGKDLPTGSYFFIIEYRDDQGGQSTGAVSILRKN